MLTNSASDAVKIEGILSEIDLKPTSYTKDGKTIEAIGGSIKIRLEQFLRKDDEKPTLLEVPVYIFANKFTKAGAANPAYENAQKVMNEFVSIAASDYEHADRVRITKGSLRMNEYFKDGKLVSYPRVNTSFVTKIKPEDCNQTATFNLTIAIANHGYVLDNDGVPTDKYEVTGILPQYGGKVDVIKFIAANDNVANAIQEYWEEGCTVPIGGKLNFSSTTKKVVKEVAFGDPIEDVQTISVNELLITSGNLPLDGELAFDPTEIAEALKERKNRLATLKENTGRKTKAPAPSVAKGFADLGF